MDALLLPAREPPKDRQAHSRDPMGIHRRSLNREYVGLCDAARWQLNAFNDATNNSVRARQEGRDPEPYGLQAREAFAELNRLNERRDIVEVRALREGAI